MCFIVKKTVFAGWWFPWYIKMVIKTVLLTSQCYAVMLTNNYCWKQVLFPGTMIDAEPGFANKKCNEGCQICKRRVNKQPGFQWWYRNVTKMIRNRGCSRGCFQDLGVCVVWIPQVRLLFFHVFGRSHVKNVFETFREICRRGKSGLIGDLTDGETAFVK